MKPSEVPAAEHIYGFLQEQGYVGPVKEQYKDHCVYFYRRIPGTHHQWIVREHKCDLPNGSRLHGFEVEMIYETSGHIWANTHYYGLGEQELRNHLSGLEQALYLAVVPMGGNFKDQQYGSNE